MHINITYKSKFGFQNISSDVIKTECSKYSALHAMVHSHMTNTR